MQCKLHHFEFWLPEKQKELEKMRHIRERRRKFIDFLSLREGWIFLCPVSAPRWQHPANRNTSSCCLLCYLLHGGERTPNGFTRAVSSIQHTAPLLPSLWTLFKKGTKENLDACVKEQPAKAGRQWLLASGVVGIVAWSMAVAMCTSHIWCYASSAKSTLKILASLLPHGPHSPHGTIHSNWRVATDPKRHFLS